MWSRRIRRIRNIYPIQMKKIYLLRVLISNEEGFLDYYRVWAWGHEFSLLEMNLRTINWLRRGRYPYYCEYCCVYYGGNGRGPWFSVQRGWGNREEPAHCLGKFCSAFLAFRPIGSLMHTTAACSACTLGLQASTGFPRALMLRQQQNCIVSHLVTIGVGARKDFCKQSNSKMRR